MTMDINYQITFHSCWHCGSGLAAGADVDALVVKDKDQLPFVPGKTMKGLVREAIQDLMQFRNETNETLFREAFGVEGDQEEMQRGTLFFTNAELGESEAAAIRHEVLSAFLYRSVTSTAIGENGIAKEHSLRKAEVTVPCTLYGSILNIPSALSKDMGDALQFIKRIGKGRNRGLGRCTITLYEKGGRA